MEAHQRILSFVNELRKSILALGILILCGSIGFYLISPVLLHNLQGHLNQQLAFFSVAEPFLSQAKLAFFVTLFVVMPFTLYCFWKALAKPFGLSNGTRNWFIIFTCLLFYSGASFCYFITLPFGVKFLLGFQSTQLKPIISVEKFVTFVTMFILAFGIIFQLPVFMIFSAKTGLCPRQVFEKNRRYAVLAICIVAALLTPTPDVVNMLLMGGPLYLLYEIGILVLKVLRIK
ncbi:MAG: twin-arginine translocase subunit TatC [Proteobacteria bacterium]|nr:twin-arginine translocase subunit TatC [Pseudomonadota bacterium]MBU1709594.1 twin-arginine translocase subunit TatC [Pseudomonadota bacterium]